MYVLEVILNILGISPIQMIMEITIERKSPITFMLVSLVVNELMMEIQVYLKPQGAHLHIHTLLVCMYI
jgi:hypothetical protein